MLAVVLLHVFGLIALLFPRTWTDTPASRVAAAGAVLFASTLMLSSAMSRIIVAFHERRDLDFLLGAPVAPALLLVVRALTVVAAVWALGAVFVYPVANVGVASGRWWIARIYFAVPLLAFATTGLALAATGAIVRLIGVRRARVGLQVLSALIGASFYLVSQARQFLPSDWSTAAMRWARAAATDGDAPSPVRWAAALVDGDAATTAILAVAAIGVFALSVWSARNRFVDVARTPEADARVVAAPPGAMAQRIDAAFGRPLLATLVVKEWRLLARAPQLISQVLLQLLYLTPLLFVAFRHGSAPVAWTTASLAAGGVGLTATLATSLAWLTVSGEDAPDLLAGSPQRRATILSAKLVAAVLPPLALLALAAAGIARRSVGDAAVVFAFGLLAGSSAAILAAASPSGGRRNDFQRRHRGRAAMAIVEALQFLLWAAAAAVAVTRWWVASIPIAAVALSMPAYRLARVVRSGRRRLIGADVV